MKREREISVSSRRVLERQASCSPVTRAGTACSGCSDQAQRRCNQISSAIIVADNHAARAASAAQYGFLGVCTKASISKSISRTACREDPDAISRDARHIRDRHRGPSNSGRRRSKMLAAFSGITRPNVRKYRGQLYSNASWSGIVSSRRRWRPPFTAKPAMKPMPGQCITGNKNFKFGDNDQYTRGKTFPG